MNLQPIGNAVSVTPFGSFRLEIVFIALGILQASRRRSWTSWSIDIGDASTSSATDRSAMAVIVASGFTPTLRGQQIDAHFSLQ